MENYEDVPIVIVPLTPEQKKEFAEAQKAEPERLKAEAQEARRQAYVRISDPIYMQWKRGLKTEQEWLDAVAQVETDYPIPGESDA